MAKKQLVVISNQEQLRLLKQQIDDFSTITVACDNFSYTRALEAEHIDYILLEEGLLEDSWMRINSWACDKALNWGHILKRDRSLFAGIELNSALYVYFSYYLVAMLKNYLYARDLLNTYMPQEVIIFRAHGVDFPRFNNNSLLNRFLEQEVQRRALSLRVIDSASGSKTKPQLPLKRVLKKAIQAGYGSFKRADEGKSVYLACGVLRHVAPLIEELRRRGEEVVFFDFEFYLENYKYCAEKKVTYCIPENLTKDTKVSGGNFRDDFFSLLESFKKDAWFRFDEVDLSDIVCEEIYNSCDSYLSMITMACQWYDRLSDTYKIRSLILDEDWSPRQGFMAAHFKSRAVGVFCVSHGYGAQRFSLAPSLRNFHLSRTIVHSEFEKALYGARGWKEDYLYVTGSPKYDQLLTVKEKMHKNNKKLTVLFCGTSLREIALTDPTYIGVTQYERGRYMGHALQVALEAMKKRNCKLIVRPHPSDVATGVHEKKMWAEVIDSFQGKAEVVLDEVKDEFISILSSCDAMIVAYWTPAIIEALILGIPVLVLNPAQLKDGFPFAEQGLCLAAHDAKGVDDFLQQLDEHFFSDSTKAARLLEEAKRTFYLGRNDKHNSERAADLIQSHYAEIVQKLS